MLPQQGAKRVEMAEVLSARTHADIHTHRDEGKQGHLIHSFISFVR